MDRYAYVIIITLFMMAKATKLEQTLSLCVWNSRGLSASIPYIRELSTQHDIILLTEHWLHSNRLKKLGEISNRMNFCARASKHSDADNYGSIRGQGGVAILWKKELSCITPLNWITHDRICGVRLENTKGTIFCILCVYLPAVGSDEDYDQIIDELSAILNNIEEGSYILIGGDFNADLGTSGGPRGAKVCNKQGKAMYNFVTRHNYVAANLMHGATGVLNTFCGPRGESCIDYCLVPKDCQSSIKKCHTRDFEVLNTSDHRPVTLRVDLHKILRTTIEIETKKSLKWDKLSPDQLQVKYTAPVNSKLQELFNNMCLLVPTSELIDEIFDRVIQILREGELKIPVSKFKRNLKPFWCDELEDLKKNKVRIYKEWCAKGKPRGNEYAIYRAHRLAEKVFRTRLKQLGKSYDDENILKASRSAEINKNMFWRLLKREKSNGKSSYTAINNEQGKSVYRIEQVLDVWASHFDKLSTPKHDDSYDEAHYDMVNNKVEGWLKNKDIDGFSEEFFSVKEIEDSIKKLNAGKSPGYDGITKEHLIPAGHMLPTILMLAFKWIFTLEYIPNNFRQGVQIPLHKGKNTSILDTNNFRGITLLSTFNKIFEMLVWSRMKEWWLNGEVISNLQGACRPGLSCVHTTLLMQETIAQQLETHKNIFVCYLDVTKAFDGIWINGLFYRLHQLGIRGRIWRLLYKCYIDFTARVRIQGKFSRSYKMLCGIHQGGYLSSLKYIAFIDSLIRTLENSRICCTMGRMNTTPLGYADDMATATVSKLAMDKVFSIVHLHSRKWRYDFNAKKCAVVVHGESERENKVNSRHRSYKLGNEYVKETNTYEHLGLVTYNNFNYTQRTKDKISKGRRALSAASGIGIKHGGVSIKACNILFWSMIVPMVTYATELWILKDPDIELLEDFQKYAGKRIQRLHPRAPNVMSYVTLGWIRLENFINIKKLLFIRTILVLEEVSIHKKVFRNRLHQFMCNPVECSFNMHDSPIFDMLRIACIYGIFENIVRMMNGTHFYTKHNWREQVWSNAWMLEDRDWDFRKRYFGITKMYKNIQEYPVYSVWWKIADRFPSIMRQCEIMIKLICGASRLKTDDKRCESNRCVKCNNYAKEDAFHIIMQCDSTENLRREMQHEIVKRIGIRNFEMITSGENFFNILMGKCHDGIHDYLHVEIWIVACIYISKMYWSILSNRIGIG